MTLKLVPEFVFLFNICLAWLIRQSRIRNGFHIAHWIPGDLPESNVSDMFVVFEMVEAVDLPAANRDIIERQIQDLRVRRSPKDIRLFQDARRSNVDILKEDAGELTGSSFALNWIGPGFYALHGNHEMLQRRSRILDPNVAKNDPFAAPPFSLTAHIKQTPATPVIPASPRVDHVAVLHNDMK